MASVRRFPAVPVLFLVAVLLVGASSASAQTETVLYSFGASGGGILSPYYGLTIDGRGRLFGASHYGGDHNLGGVFALARSQDGSWQEQVVHGFEGGANDGSLPFAEVVVNESGDVYGTTFGGGTGRCRGWEGCGTVFKLKERGPGKWTARILYDFRDEGNRYAVGPTGVFLRGKRDVYGTSISGGKYGAGEFFRLTCQADGHWTHTALYDFPFDTDTSEYPTSGLVMDSQGNLYGTSSGGGDHHLGTVFQLSPNPGRWTEQTLYSFDHEGSGSYGPTLNANLAIDGQGNLYGTTQLGGHVEDYTCPFGCGFVFKVSRGPDGSWSKQNLHEFLGGEDGAWPYDGVIVDAAGNVYGTTRHGGGAGSCAAGDNVLYCGTVFKLTPQPDGSYVETILHSFSDKPDGAEPYARPVLDSAGNLYGTTIFGGSLRFGTVYQISPQHTPEKH